MDSPFPLVLHQNPTASICASTYHTKIGMWTLEEVKAAIANSRSFRGASRILGSPTKRRELKTYAQQMNLDFSHFDFGKRSMSYVGSNFGYLTIATVLPPQNGGRWQCLCNCKCGAQVTKRLDQVISNHSKSCGCAMQDRDYWGANNPAFRGYGELTGGKFWELQAGAKARGLEFSITKEYIWKLYEAQGRRCALTGVPIAFGKQGTETSPSLDRIDSKHGYTESNVQWVHMLVNQMKWTISQPQFVEICHLVAGYNPRPAQVQLTVEHSRVRHG